MSPFHIVGDVIADAVNPALTIAVLVVVVQEYRRRAIEGVRCLFAAALGLASIYAIGALDRALWQRLGMDYSTHAAYALSLITSMLVWRRRWVNALAAVALGYLVLIVAMGYHRVAEVILASVAAVLVTLPWHVLVRRVGARAGSIGSTLTILLLLAACSCPEEYRPGAYIAYGSGMATLAGERGDFLVLTGAERISRNELRDRTLLHAVVLIPNVHIRGAGTSHQGDCLRATETFTWKLGHWRDGPFNLGERKLVIEYDGDSRQAVIGGRRFDTRRGNYFLITLDEHWMPHTRQIPLVREGAESFQAAFAALRPALTGVPQFEALRLYSEDQPHQRRAPP